MSKRTFTQAALALIFVLGVPSAAAAQLGEEVRQRDQGEAIEEHERDLDHHRAEMERHRAEMERHAHAMREALMRAHGDSGGTYWRHRAPDARFLYSARVRQPCARMGIAFTGDDTITVEEVMEGSGAAAAGVRAGDVIVSINGERADVRTMIELAESLEADDRVRLVVRRDGREQTLDVTAQEDVCPLRTMLSPEPFEVTCMKRDSSDVATDEDCAHDFVYRLRENFGEMHDSFPLRVYTEQGDSGTWLHFEGPDGERSLFIDLDSMRLMADEFSFQLDSLREMMPFTVHMADSLRLLMPKIQLDMREAAEAMHAHGLMVRSLEL
ncbi:MAG TPA: PDZ domain-containing protein, partial [Thermoanaerobaculia bacterium]